MLQKHVSTRTIVASHDPDLSTWHLIHAILEAAREKGHEGPVARHLIGASLQLAFPNIRISNEPCSITDDHLRDAGDFHVGDTAFHVTVAPMSVVCYERCKRNIEEGLRAYLLVPDRILAGARQNAEATAPGQIGVASVESFVSQNIEELSTFSKNRLIEGFRHLLETYNTRVDAVENDKSMLIEIPQNLLR